MENYVQMEMQAKAKHLSDDTKVAEWTWEHLKESAMVDEYHKKGWYKDLEIEERSLVNRLRVAQRNQGNMGKLKFVNKKNEDFNKWVLANASCGDEFTDSANQLLVDNLMLLVRHSRIGV